jgi:putrescine aminotransferase
VDGVDVVIGKREGYYFYDVDGKKLMNVHLNGGTYYLGHRNPEVIAALIEGTNYFRCTGGTLCKRRDDSS